MKLVTLSRLERGGPLCDECFDLADYKLDVGVERGLSGEPVWLCAACRVKLGTLLSTAQP